jgi:glycosyltransferase involved in cell wall biosynthesis
VTAVVVSVVIATRNRRTLLAEAIDSVRRQQEPAWELIVVDDASTDDTPAYLAQQASLMAIRQEANTERSTARNRGLTVASGRYVMFLDDDDTLHADALRALTSALDRNPDAVAAIGAREDWFVGESYRRRDIHPRSERNRDLFDEFLFGWSAVSGQNLYRTNVVREVGGYDATLQFVEDRDLWLRIARIGPVVLCPSTVMTYRISTTQNRPDDIRERRELVARRAIRGLPSAKRRRALMIRRSTACVDAAEDAVRDGHPLSAIPALGRAVRCFPALVWTPLLSVWIARRLVGRAYHRWRRG